MPGRYFLVANILDCGHTNWNVFVCSVFVLWKGTIYFCCYSVSGDCKLWILKYSLKNERVYSMTQIMFRLLLALWARVRQSGSDLQPNNRYGLILSWCHSTAAPSVFVLANSNKYLHNILLVNKRVDIKYAKSENTKLRNWTFGDLWDLILKPWCSRHISLISK